MVTFTEEEKQILRRIMKHECANLHSGRQAGRPLQPGIIEKYEVILEKVKALDTEG